MIKSLVTEFGVPWIINRSLYSLKLKMIKNFPVTENLFEKNIEVKRLDIFDLEVDLIEDFLTKLDQDNKDEILAVANNAIVGKIKAFSSIELDYGNPINWHYNPITKKEINKKVKWFKIPDFDPDRGDIKIIWEASRFTHFYYFIRAFIISKDKKYYNSFSEQLNSWIENNHYSFGVNYKCGQEATLRMINSLMAFTVFKKYNLVSDKDEKNIIKIIEGSYKKVISNFFYAHKCIRNNHTLSEICGLIIGAWCCNDNKALLKSYRLLEEELEKQFTSEGRYIQYSFNYQRFALQLLECVLKISGTTKIELSEQIKKRIEKSILLMFNMQDECGDVPNYGPNDGALIFPVTICEYRDFRPVLNTVYALIKGERLFPNGVYDEELLWFGCTNNYPMSNIHRKPIGKENSGFYTFRNDDGFLMVCLHNFNTRPSHMDQLHIDLWHKGVNIFCDSGTYSYASELGKQLSLTSGHNTVKLEGKEQMNKRGAFLVTDWTTRRNVFYNDNYFTGTMVSKNGYEHTRAIKQTESGYQIEDSVKGDGNYEFYFHTPCDVVVEGSKINLYYNDDHYCSITTNENIEINTTYRSLYYMKSEKINCIVIKPKETSKNKKFLFNINLY